MILMVCALNFKICSFVCIWKIEGKSFNGFLILFLCIFSAEEFLMCLMFWIITCFLWRSTIFLFQYFNGWFLLSSNSVAPNKEWMFDLPNGNWHMANGTINFYQNEIVLYCSLYRLDSELQEALLINPESSSKFRVHEIKATILLSFNPTTKFLLTLVILNRIHDFLVRKVPFD